MLPIEEIRRLSLIYAQGQTPKSGLAYDNYMLSSMWKAFRLRALRAAGWA